MRNRIDKAYVVTVITLLILSMGCGITVTKNYYYTNPSQNFSKPMKYEIRSGQVVDTICSPINEQN